MLSKSLGVSSKIPYLNASLKKFLRTVTPALLIPGLLLAQRNGNPPLECAACSVVIAIPIAIIVLNIALLIWVAKDAKARGMDNPVLWMVLVGFTSFIGLIVYRYSRPKGELIPCSNCKNQRLQFLVKCPSCGIDSGSIVQNSI
jgi:hypothetical protein